MADNFISSMEAAGTLTGDELLELSLLSETVTITAATISAQASDNSFNDSADGFIAAGFAVDDRVKVTGFTGDTANNIFAATVTALTAGKMTIGGEDGDVIVDDAAGESVTISKWESKRAAINELPFDSGGGGGGAGGTLTEQLAIALSDETTALTTGAGKVTIHAPFAFDITDALLGLSTVASAGATTMDVNLNGVSIFTTLPSIAAGDDLSFDASSTDAVLTSASIAVAKGDELTFDLDAVGTDAAGAKAYLIIERDGGATALQEWAPNFTAAGDLYIPVPDAMTVDQGNAAIGTGTITFAKSTAAAPSTFSAATLPVTLEAGAWLKVTAASVTGFVATHLVRTA